MTKISENYKLFILKNEYNKHISILKEIEINIENLFRDILIENETYLIYNIKIQNVVKYLNKMYNDYYINYIINNKKNQTGDVLDLQEFNESNYKLKYFLLNN